MGPGPTSPRSGDPRSRSHLRSSIFDVVVAVAATALAVSVADSIGVSGAAWAPAIYALLVVHGLSLLFRRRYPRAVLGVNLSAFLIVVALYPGFIITPTVLIPIYSVAAYSDRRSSLIAVAAAEVGAASMALVSPQQDVLTWLGNSILIGVAWLLGDLARTRLLYTAQLEQRAVDLAREREERARAAVLAERTRIARELHDVIAHNVSVMVIQAHAASEMLNVDPGQASQALATIQNSGNETLTELRHLVGILRMGDEGDRLAPQAGLDAVQTLIDHARDAGIHAELEIKGKAVDLPPGIDVAAYRIVQEALTNVIKHARASRARVTLEYGDRMLSVRIVDDGRNVPAPDGGHGLIGMRERTAMYGGRLVAGGRPQGGFEVLAELPFERG